MGHHPLSFAASLSVRQSYVMLIGLARNAPTSRGFITRSPRPPPRLSVTQERVTELRQSKTKSARYGPLL